MSNVDPELTDHGNGEPSFAWGDDIPSDSEDDEYTPSSDNDSSTENSDGDPMEIDELKEPLTLLKVPGEIRNLIYRIMREDGIYPPRNNMINIAQPKDPRMLLALRDRNTRITFREPPPESTDWTSFKRQFLGLTQVNRQLRMEAVDSRDGYGYNVFLSQLEAYVKDFFVDSVRNLDLLSWTRIYFLNDDSVDIKSLSLTMARLSGLRGMFHRQNLPAWIFGTKVSAEWLSYLEQYVDRVEFHTNRNCRPVQVIIYVYKDHAEDWMWKRWSSQGYPSVQEDAWLDKYGLLDRNRVNVDVEVADT